MGGAWVAQVHLCGVDPVQNLSDAVADSHRQSRVPVQVQVVRA